jgi:hypothetical protein
MDAITFAKGTVEQAFNISNMTASGMTDEQYNKSPGGTANSAAKSHVHGLTSMDFFVNGVIAGKPIKWQDFAAKHSLPANPMEIWGYSGIISLEAIQGYAATVKDDVLTYIGSLSEADLDKQIETQFFGTQSIAWIIQLGVVHLTGHVGDMAGIKGIQGLKGLPF